MTGNKTPALFSGMSKSGSPQTGKIQVRVDKDNIISDKEMLAVYDDFPGMEKDDLPVEVELIEEIWMGTKYFWNPVKKEFTLLGK